VAFWGPQATISPVLRALGVPQVTSFVLAIARTITDVPLLVVKSNSSGGSSR